jgi:hypothetical protein
MDEHDRREPGISLSRTAEVVGEGGRGYKLVQDGTRVRIEPIGGFGWKQPAVEISDLERALKAFDS